MSDTWACAVKSCYGSVDYNTSMERMFKTIVQLDSAHHITDGLNGNKLILIEIMYHSKHKHSGREAAVQ